MQPTEHRRHAARASGATNGLLAILLFVMAGYIAFEQIWPRWMARHAAPRVVTPRGDLADFEKAAIEVFERSARSVVHVANTQVDEYKGITRDVFQFKQGKGTGFIWDNLGHVVTNYHVVDQADALVVRLPNQTSWPARVVGASPEHDVAVLHVDAPRAMLEPIPIGDSASLRVGQAVMAIGNPFGLDQSLTTGVISALHRDIEEANGRRLRDMIQTDAAINPGNSGGPLLDSAGRLIGVNTAIFSPTRVSAGIGFATPVDVVNDIVPELIKHGRIQRPHLGVSLHPQTAQRLGVEGLLIVFVQPDSPAEKAGLIPTQTVEGRLVLGDIILGIDGEPTPTTQALRDILARHQVGGTVHVTILRGDRQMNVPVVLEAAPDGE